MNVIHKRSLIAFALLCFIFCSTAHAQRGNHWHFGDGAGLDFTGGGAPVATTSAIDTDEGCSSISDPAGNSLFYTDGSTVFQANGVVMAGGTNLGGNTSATQSAIIMPNPANTDQYFIYVADAQCGGGAGGNNGIQMAIVDMTSNGGLGAVISANNPVLPGASATEKISATCHENGTDYWVVTQRRNDGDILAYRVDGMSSFLPVVSPGATTLSACNPYVGQLKLSPSGRRLAIMDRGNGNAVLYDFDPGSGAATNPRIIRGSTTYGCEFSPNSDVLYVTTFGRLFQYDATQNTTAGLQATETQIAAQGTGGQLGSVQIGPNGRLYVANGGPFSSHTTLDEIQQPDVLGAGCNFVNDAINLSAGTLCGLGLPNFTACIAATEPCDLGESARIFPTQYSNCTWGFNQGIIGGGGNGNTQIVSHFWDFGDGTTSTDPFPSHTYATPGFYSVCYTVTGFNGVECCTSTQCLEGIAVGECDPCDELNPLFNMNGGGMSFSFTAAQIKSGSGVYWDFGDGNSAVGNSASHTYTTPGVYTVCITEIFTDQKTGTCCTETFCEQIDVSARGKKSTARVKEAVEPGSQVNMNVFPNPTQDQVTISFLLEEAHDVELTILDLQGQVIKELIAPANKAKGNYKLSFDTQDLPAGVYFVNLKSDMGNFTQRLAVMK